MATAYTALIRVQGQDGWTYSYPVTASDVAAEYWKGTDLDTSIIFPAVHGRITVFDVIVSSAGGTTKNTEVFVNGVSTGINAVLSANLATNLSRQFMGSPIVCSPGSKFMVIQRA